MNENKCWYEGVCTAGGSPCQKLNSCIRYSEMQYLISESGIPKARQYNLGLDVGEEDYNAFCRLADIKDTIADFVRDGKNLYITSRGTGNGKTTWAIKLLLKYFDTIWAGNGYRVRGLFTHIPTLLLQFKNFENPLSKEYLQNLDESDLVVFDDIASTELSKYDYSQLLTHIDTRILNKRSCIFTGNLVSAEELKQSLGDRLTSRVWNTSEIITFNGKDRR